MQICDYVITGSGGDGGDCGAGGIGGNPGKVSITCDTDANLSDNLAGIVATNGDTGSPGRPGIGGIFVICPSVNMLCN